mmetsp:Transcript_20771/g.30754  ORF Transcript_20771/g.30754 Transcript_20771/m.30754 type:complete len:201 (-) Transcript_20771:504-1106(-)
MQFKIINALLPSESLSQALMPVLYVMRSGRASSHSPFTLVFCCLSFSRTCLNKSKAFWGCPLVIYRAIKLFKQYTSGLTFQRTCISLRIFSAVVMGSVGPSRATAIRLLNVMQFGFSPDSVIMSKYFMQVSYDPISRNDSSSSREPTSVRLFLPLAAAAPATPLMIAFHAEISNLDPTLSMRVDMRECSPTFPIELKTAQ